MIPPLSASSLDRSLLLWLCIGQLYWMIRGAHDGRGTAKDELSPQGQQSRPRRRFERMQQMMLVD
jgi:hypothetical protein